MRVSYWERSLHSLRWKWRTAMTRCPHRPSYKSWLRTEQRPSLPTCTHRNRRHPRQHRRRMMRRMRKCRETLLLCCSCNKEKTREIRDRISRRKLQEEDYRRLPKNILADAVFCCIMWKFYIRELGQHKPSHDFLSYMFKQPKLRTTGLVL
jgi:hypothetical protein